MIDHLALEAEEARRELSSLRDRACRSADIPSRRSGAAEILREVEGRLAVAANTLRARKADKIRASLSYEMMGQIMKCVAAGDFQGTTILQKRLWEASG